MKKWEPIRNYKKDHCTCTCWFTTDCHISWIWFLLSVPSKIDWLDLLKKRLTTKILLGELPCEITRKSLTSSTNDDWVAEFASDVTALKQFHVFECVLPCCRCTLMSSETRCRSGIFFLQNRSFERVQVAICFSWWMLGFDAYLMRSALCLFCPGSRRRLALASLICMILLKHIVSLHLNAFSTCRAGCKTEQWSRIETQNDKNKRRTRRRTKRRTKRHWQPH